MMAKLASPNLWWPGFSHNTHQVQVFCFSLDVWLASQSPSASSSPSHQQGKWTYTAKKNSSPTMPCCYLCIHFVPVYQVVLTCHSSLPWLCAPLCECTALKLKAYWSWSPVSCSYGIMHDRSHAHAYSLHSLYVQSSRCQISSQHEINWAFDECL